MARQEMVSKVRAQEEAEHLTRGAVDPSLNGAGTPPSAFEADEAVTRFMAKWLYMTAGLGDTSRNPLTGRFHYSRPAQPHTPTQ